MTMRTVLFFFFIFLYLVSNANAQSIYANYSSGELSLLIPASQLTGRINDYLNRNVSGSIQDTDTEKASVRNFRTSFIDRKIRIRFDYSAKKRGWTKRPVVGGRWYSPWVSDSGWIEVDVWPGIQNWKFSANTRSGHVRWNSNNWFTNNIVKGFADNDLRSQVSSSVNYAIQSYLGQRSLNLRSLVIDHGAPPLAKALGISVRDANNKLAGVLNQTGLDSFVNRDGLSIVARMNRYGLACIENRTNMNIAYNYKWGDGRWESTSVDSRGNRSHYWTYKGANQSSAGLRIKFDYDLSNNNRYRVHLLKKHAVPEKKCNLGKRYYFSRNGDSLGLHEY